MDALDKTMLGEVREQEVAPPEHKRCLSRSGGRRCQKLRGHAGLHGFVRWTLAESHRWS